MSRHLGKQEEREFEADQLLEEFKLSRSKIMYIEDKSEDIEGEARIGRVYFSKSGKTLYYRGRRFQSLKGSGFKENYFEVGSGDHYWISGPRKGWFSWGNQADKYTPDWDTYSNHSQ